VAIKKFKESDKDDTIKKISTREIRFLKMCDHENIVHLKESFRRKEKLHLVFEFVDRTVLEILEKTPKGIDVSVSVNPARLYSGLPLPGLQSHRLLALQANHPQRREAREPVGQQVNSA
jgi:serine/threonine protein kinase